MKNERLFEDEDIIKAMRKQTEENGFVNLGLIRYEFHCNRARALRLIAENGFSRTPKGPAPSKKSSSYPRSDMFMILEDRPLVCKGTDSVCPIGSNETCRFIMCIEDVLPSTPPWHGQKTTEASKVALERRRHWSNIINRRFIRLRDNKIKKEEMVNDINRILQTASVELIPLMGIE